MVLDDFENDLRDIIKIVGKELGNDFFDESDLLNMITKRQRDYETVRRFLKRNGRNDLLDTVENIKNLGNNELVSELTELARSYGCDLKSFIQEAQSMFNLNPEYEYALSSFMTKTVPNEKNFYRSSVGFWDVTETPDREPDHISYSSYGMSVSSDYWYTNSGVYRRSDHWGTGVASCDWYLSDAIKSGLILRYETAFIRWKDLKAKGIIYLDNGIIESIRGFDFSIF